MREFLSQDIGDNQAIAEADEQQEATVAMMAKAVTIEHEHDSMLGFGNDIGLWPELASQAQRRQWNRNVRLNPLGYETGDEVQQSLSDQFCTTSFISVIDQFNV